MRTLTFIFLLFSEVLMANSLNSSYELIYIYGSFIIVVLLIVGIDKSIKFIYKKFKERSRIPEEQHTSNATEE